MMKKFKIIFVLMAFFALATVPTVTTHAYYDSWLDDDYDYWDDYWDDDKYEIDSDPIDVVYDDSDTEDSATEPEQEPTPTYSVTYDTLGGTPVPPTQIAHGKTTRFIKPDDPELEGSEFIGWASEVTDDSYEMYYISYSFITRDYNLTAIYEHKVTFDANGGIFTKADIFSTPKESFSLYVRGPLLVKTEYAETVERDGFTFKGWYTDEACTKKWDMEKDKVYKSMTIYAGWKGKAATVKFKGAGTLKTYAGKTISPPSKNPTRKGYIFNGWYKNSSCTKEWDFDKDIVESSSVTLYPDWIPKSYTIKYVTNGGTKVSSVKAYYGDEIPVPEWEPIKSGMSFADWYIDKEFLFPYYLFTVKGNTTLYAKWSGDITMKLDANGGKFKSGNTVISVTKGDSFYFNSEIPTRSGYNFNGWFKDKACKERLSDWNYVQAFSGTAYAGWSKMCLVKFELNGGTGKFNSMNVWPGNTITVSNPTRSGYTFKGWYTDKNFKNSWNSGSKINSNTTLYAKWERITAVSIQKKATYYTEKNYDGVGRDLLKVRTTLKFTVAGTYTIEHDFRSGNNRELYKSFKEKVSANQTLTINQDFILTHFKMGTCTYYIRVLDSSGKVVLEQKYTMPWDLYDIGVNMAIEG